MTDYFAVLEVPRRPWLDPDALKQKFLALSSEFHPDRSQGSEAKKRELQDRSTTLNAAYHCLTNPKERLSHLILLERGAPASDLQNVPAELMDFFMQVASACRATDDFLRQKAAATSPLLKAQLFERSQSHADELEATRKKVDASREQLEHRLKELDTAWQGADVARRIELLRTLEELRRLFGFFDRWLSQLQERFVQLAL